MFLYWIKKIFFILALLLFCQYSFSTEEEYAYFFNQNGEIIKSLPEEWKGVPATIESNVKYNILSNGSILISWNEQKIVGNPGDFISPLWKDKNYIYLRSEKNTNYAEIIKLNISGKENKISIPNEEIYSIIVDREKILGIEYGKLIPKYIFFDTRLKHLHQKIMQENPGSIGIKWYEKSPIAAKWIAAIVYKDRPIRFIVCCLEQETYHYLSKKTLANKCYKFDITYTASDGENISAIITIPEKNNNKKYPLIVFPHGGPGSKTTLAFDHRVNCLIQNGFAVFQPNYRGSHGFGKKFRQQGWGIKGIKRQNFGKLF